MTLKSEKLKQTMLELTGLFRSERNIFQKFVIVYRYIGLINHTPIAKGVLQKIFDDAAEAMGKAELDCQDRNNFLNIKNEAACSNDFWIYYGNLEIIYGKMKRLKACREGDKKEFEDLCRLFSKPYSKEMLELSFKVVNSNIFDRLDQEIFFNETDNEGKTWFDEKNSILYVKGERIPIDRTGKTTNAHKLLRHIFITNKDNLNDEFFYSEIAFDEFEDMEYKKDKNGWKKYFTACEKIRDKILANTRDKITNFLIFNTGKKGRIKINSDYI